MRLIVSVDALRPPLTGVGRYTWELVRRLQTAPGIKQLRFFKNGSWVADPARLLLEPAWATAIAETTAAPAPAAPRALRLARDLYWNTTCRFNVFHAPNYFLPPFARNGVVTVHDLSVLKYPGTHPVERVKQFERSFTRTLGIASHLITDSNSVRLEVIGELGWPAARVTAIPLGVGDEYHPRLADAVRTVAARHGVCPGHYSLCVATIEPRKRIDALLAAYGRLPQPLRRAIPLVLVGSAGWQADRLHAAIDAAGKAGWLFYLGYVPAEDLPLLYAGARMFAYLSDYEGFGLPVAEAMASGVPVVTSTAACLREVAAGAALLADPDDPPALTETLTRALTDDQWRLDAIARGITAAARYTWKACAEQTMDVYRAALRS